MTAAGAAIGAPARRLVPPAAAEEDGPVEGARPSQWREFWQRLSDERAAYIGVLVFGGLVVACVLGPWLLPYGPNEIDFEVLSSSGPSAKHPLGTDPLGRDELTRLLVAGRISILIGVMVSLICATIGSIVGVIAGYYGGRVDRGLMALVDVLLSVPPLALLIALAVVVSSPSSGIGAVVRALPEEWRIIVVMSSLGWMSVARIVRSQVISLKNQEFVEAQHALGAPDWRIMFIHILPNSVPVIIVFSTFGIAASIMGESSLSFLGVGVNPPTATWGNMISEASDISTMVNYWWLVLFPAIAIIATVLSANFVGEGIRVALDPKSRK